MSDAAEAQIEEVEQPAEQPAEEPKETTTEAPADPPKVEFTPEQQEVFNASISKKVAKQKQAEREAEEARQRAAELEEKLKAAQQPERPTVPPKPDDPFDDDYAQRMDAWATATAEQKAYDEQVSWQERQAAEAQQAEHVRQQQAYQQKATEFFDRGDKLGISQVELGQANQQINAFNLHQDVVDHLVDDERGPEMALYLSQNLGDLDAVANMTPTKAAVYLETVVKPKSRREPPKVTPPPAETDTGSSVTETEDGIDYE